jgi:hypothetical protein
VSTGEKKAVVEQRNPNTANMQYRNVLFFKEALMDYNNNLAASGGAQVTERAQDRKFCFWRVSTPDGQVYVAVTEYPTAGAGIIEVGTEGDHDGFEAFQRDVKDNPSTCHDTGLSTTYTSCRGDRIAYDHGQATVNGEPWPLDGYALYESPYAQSEHGSGVIEIVKGRRSVRLDFREKDNPIRIERGE